MSINRTITVSVPAFSFDETIGVSAVVTTGAAVNLFGAAINGSIIDRLGYPGSNYPAQLSKDDRAMAASPFALVWSTMGTTAANNLTVIDCILQHGDSSGGGDMAYLSSGGVGQDATARSYWTTANSSAALYWTAGGATAPPRLHSNSAEYTLDRAKRYIRPVTTVTRAGATTVATDIMHCIQGITFKEFVYAPPSVLTYTTATST